MIKISVSGKLPDLSGKLSKGLRQMASDLEKELKNNTPVDTGYAKSRWKRKTTRKGGTINNDADYIEYLEEGRSRQAPNGMIKPAMKKIVSNFNKGKYI
jgi:hypothetical protein